MKVGIIGAGPAALMAAVVLKDSTSADITILDIGEGLEKRRSVTEGFGGAGAYSDGKFNLSSRIGSRLYELVNETKVQEAILEVDDIYMKYGAPGDNIKQSEFSSEFKVKCRRAGFNLTTGATRHWGTDVGRTVIENIYNDIKDRVDILQEAIVSPYIVEDDKVYVAVRHENVEKSFCFDYLIVAVGRSGSRWMHEFYKYGFPYNPGATDIGVRYECRNEVFEDIYKLSFEPKLSMMSSRGERVRLFCSCLQDGHVALEDYRHSNITCVNGHSYSGEHPTGNANFAILCTSRFTHPFDDPDSFCRNICAQVNLLGGGGAIIQAYQDFKRGRRSYDHRIVESGIVPTCKATAGDISCVLPYKTMVGISEFVDGAEEIFPGVSQGLMYAPEVKFYSHEAVLENLAYKDHQRIYPVGDCSGWTRSLAGASAHGYLVAKKIAGRIV